MIQQLSDDEINEILDFISYPSHASLVCRDWREKITSRRHDMQWMNSSWKLRHALQKYKEENATTGKLSPSLSQIVQLSSSDLRNGEYHDYFVNTAQALDIVEQNILIEQSKSVHVSKFAEFHFKLVKMYGGIALLKLLLIVVAFIGIILYVQKRNVKHVASWVLMSFLFVYFVVCILQYAYILAVSARSFDFHYGRECIYSIIENTAYLMTAIMVGLNLKELADKGQVTKFSESLYRFDTLIPSFLVVSPMLILHVITVGLWLDYNLGEIARKTLVIAYLAYNRQLTFILLAEYILYLIGRVMSTIRPIAYFTAEWLLCMHVSFNSFRLIIAFIPIIVCYGLESTEILMAIAIPTNIAKSKLSFTRFDVSNKNLVANIVIRLFFCFTFAALLALNTFRTYLMPLLSIPFILYCSNVFFIPLTFYVELRNQVEGTWYCQDLPDLLNPLLANEANHPRLIRTIFQESNIDDILQSRTE